MRLPNLIVKYGEENKEIKMKIIMILLLVLLTASCAQSSVGGATTWENGRETKKIDMCMAHCISEASDGKHCSEFSKDMAETCKDYLKK